MRKLYGGIEAGGTKFVCGISDEPGKLLHKIRIPTGSPEETMPKVIDYFHEINNTTPISAIGVCSFGPLDANPYSKNYGYITTSPKPGWDNYNFVNTLKEAFDIPIGFDTDVNGAALGEFYWGAGKRLQTLMYWTVGTGIGAGIIFSGKVMGGTQNHAEAGHTFVIHDKEKDPFEGVCPYHSNCLEGLASGPAIMKRWQVQSAVDIPHDHPAWDLEAEYLGYAMANAIMTVAPQRIIIGGGVMQRESLYGKIHAKTLEKLGGFLNSFVNSSNISQYIVQPNLGSIAGLYGAIALAEEALHR